MIIGYARTSTTDQKYSYQSQQERLEQAGAEKIYHEQLSATANERPQLAKLLDSVRAGDTVIVTSLDRLARNTTHLSEIMATFDRQGVYFKSLSQPIDTTPDSPHKALAGVMVALLGYVAQMELDLLRERQKAGIEKAKQAGKYKGRKPLDSKIRKNIELRLMAGETNMTAIAKECGVSRPMVYKVKDELEKSNQQNLF